MMEAAHQAEAVDAYLFQNISNKLHVTDDTQKRAILMLMEVKYLAVFF